MTRELFPIKSVHIYSVQNGYLVSITPETLCVPPPTVEDVKQALQQHAEYGNKQLKLDPNNIDAMAEEIVKQYPKYPSPSTSIFTTLDGALKYVKEYTEQKGAFPFMGGGVAGCGTNLASLLAGDH